MYRVSRGKGNDEKGSGKRRGGGKGVEWTWWTLYRGKGVMQVMESKEGMGKRLNETGIWY